MRRSNVIKRLLAAFLVFCMVFVWVLPDNARAAGIRFSQVSNDRVSANVLGKDPADLNGGQPQYADTDIVRVSIFLDKAGVIDAGYSVDDLAQNDKAMAYRDKLAKEQNALISKIERATAEKLDVIWNLTLATNLISANVKFGQIDSISRMRGVRNVVIETQYAPDVVSSGVADPNMATSSAQIGTPGSYAAGYTGAGSRIAIIDTGLDIQHLSFDPSAYAYSLSNLAAKAGVSAEDYIASLDLLDAEEIGSVLENLNALERLQLSADDMYFNEKIPFIFNYVDGNNNVTHLYDKQGEHGSHVAGIAAANAYVPNGDGTFSNAIDAVRVQGVAPDAQVLVMKVFGEGGGAYPADYMAAIEDAILLGADSINLSLGSGSPGMSADTNAEFQAIFDSLEKSGVVVSISAGNAGGWTDAAENGIPYLYLDDVSMHTGGSPGSYTNSFGVASVDNAGYVGGYLPLLKVNGTAVFYYESTDYGNQPFATLPKELEYVFLNGIGTPEQFAALGDGALAGKVALCYRGETSFFEKANAAVAAGAIGVLIVNNTTGIIGLNLTGYEYTAPVASLTMEEGEFFKTNPITDEAGNILGWTGTTSMPENNEVGNYNRPFYTMSSFSSWGVPGSLTMKPEITAPGGNILSVNGANAAYGVNDHVSYEMMSGTSMAAPQVAGMAALVAQYIRENGLVEKTGLDARTLAQSLLMSTAIPMGDGNNGGYYYPVLQQGAGLANVGAAIMADSYILMSANATASHNDGKVKIELGDDPTKTGIYTFSFTINNLTASEKTYALYADIFTQGAFAYGGALYMDTWTTGLSPMVTFTVNGKEIEGGENMFGMDFNGDGYVNSADGQALLDYATGAVTTITNMASADLDANGTIGSYDAYLFFRMLGESGAVVAPNGSATVEVTVTLSDNDRAWLANYPAGAYLEGYIYAESIVDDEGVAGTCHSIPMLGFYGNWSDPSMFEKLSYEDLLSGNARVPYLYETNYSNGLVNSLYITYGNDPSTEYPFGGNPLTLDPIYMPERNAISAANGDTISTIGFTSIRNAAASFFQILDLTNLQILANQSLGGVSSAYYNVNKGAWQNTYWELNTSTGFDEIAEGTLLNMGITLIPEYFVNANGEVAWDRLGNGTTFSMNMTVDNTAPVLKDVSMSMFNNTLNIKALDNQYVAGVVLLDAYGEYLYTMTGSHADAKPNEVYEYTLDLSKVNGASFLLQVYDYAMNCTTYEIGTQIGTVVDTVDSIQLSEETLTMQKGNTQRLGATVLPVNASDRGFTWSSSNESVAAVTEDGTVLAVSVGQATITATSTLDPNFSASCTVEVIDVSVDLNAIIWDEEGSIWFSQFNTAALPDYTKLSGDMLDLDYLAAACISPDGKTIYASSIDTANGIGYFYHIDPKTYEATLISDCGGYFYSDMTYAPNMYGTGVDALLVTYGYYVISVDPATGAWIEIIDEFDNILVGIDVCYGTYYEDYGQSEVVTYLAQADGTVIQEIYCYIAGMYTVPFNLYMYGQRATLSTGVNKASAIWFNSLHYDAENAILFWSAFEEDKDNSVTLYAIDEMNDFAVYNLGQFGEGVWPVVGLFQAPASGDPAEQAPQCLGLRDLIQSGNAPAKSTKVERIDITKEMLPSSATVPAISNSGIIIGEGEDTITVDITAKDAAGANVPSSSGLATVTFNNQALSLKSVVVNGNYTSVVKADGSVTFAYVNMNGFAADDVIATLVFDVLSTDATGIKVTFHELNEQLPNSATDMDVTFPHTNTTLEGYVAPTCTENGYSGDTICTDCGKMLQKGTTITATGHTFGDWNVTKAATCTEDGIEARACHCGETETRTIPATGHTFGDWNVTKAATCTEDGTETRACHCGVTETRTIPATGHTFGDWNVTKAATCTEDGTEARACHCGETETRTIPATGHTFGDWNVTKAATCTEDGTEARACHCGETETRTIPATGHSHTASVTAPTCTEKGFTTHTCHCGDSFVDSYVDATGHVDADNNHACDHCNADLSNAKTADLFPMAMIAIGLLSSVTALAALIFLRKKQTM